MRWRSLSFAGVLENLLFALQDPFLAWVTRRRIRCEQIWSVVAPGHPGIKSSA
jgi:hypothetical protein